MDRMISLWNSGYKGIYLIIIKYMNIAIFYMYGYKSFSDTSFQDKSNLVITGF